VIKTLKPEWLGNWSAMNGSSGAGTVVTVQEAPATPDTPRAMSYADAAKRALPAVVHIYTSQEVKASRHPFLNDPLFRHFFGDRFGDGSQRRSGLGSGVVVSPEGYILTNNHVIEGADDIEVSSNDGRKYKARVVGADPESDLAVLRIPADHGLAVISFGSSDSLRVGDAVLAIGNPFGVGQTVTSGIVSALGRTHLGINTFENFIQTDAAINPGNSGGALVDANGALIGINTAIYSQSGGSMGIGFAIPVSLARNVMDQIVKNGSVTRGWIGVEVQEITPDLAESFKLSGVEGALIAGVMRGSPADKGGIRPGDVLLKVAGKPVKNAQVMLDLIAALKPDAPSRFDLKREGNDIAVDVTIGRRPAPRRE
jgi:Do/DeqQ family serine protease